MYAYPGLTPATLRALKVREVRALTAYAEETQLALSRRFP